jgi:hypothetical protein
VASKAILNFAHIKNFVGEGKLAGCEKCNKSPLPTNLLFFPSSFLPHHFFRTIGFAMAFPLTRTMHDDT